MAAQKLSVIVPTFNERDNVAELIERIEAALEGVDYEIIYVDDDSPDGTADAVFEISRKDPRVRCIKRVGRRGLSSACIEGMCSSGAEFVAVIDGDMQHDETRLVPMLEALQADDSNDLAVGTRFALGGSMGELSNTRVKMSRFATVLGTKLLRVRTTDPMSGFFMLRRSFFYEVLHNLSGVGFKILLDIVASAKRPVQIVEIPYDMNARQHGESKLDAVVLWNYLVLIAEKTFGKIVPFRFVMFLTIGLGGAVAHLTILGLLLNVFEMAFPISQGIAVAVAMTFNYIFNNLFTYRDKRLRGMDFVRGLLIFYIACSLGAVLNLLLATYLYEHNVPWYLAGLLGAGVGAVWNYSLTRYYAWG